MAIVLLALLNVTVVTGLAVTTAGVRLPLTDPEPAAD